MAGLSGAVGLPLASRGGLWGPIVGAGTATANTAFNNYYYVENTNLFAAGGLGLAAGVAGPLMGNITTGLLNRANMLPTIPVYGPTPNFPAQGFSPNIRIYLGLGMNTFFGNFNNFVPLNNGATVGK